MRLRATVVLIAGLMLSPACARQENQVVTYPGTVAQQEPDSWVTAPPQWHLATYSNGPVGEGNVARERVVLVPAATRGLAIRLLEDGPVRALDDRSLAELFPNGAPDGNTLLKEAVGRFESEKLRRESEAKLESFKNDPRFLAWAAEWQAAAERERKLAGRLRPYLVRAVLINEATGGFTASTHDGELWISHGSLGRGVNNRAPAVVFLEHKPKALYVTAISAL